MVIKLLNIVLEKQICYYTYNVITQVPSFVGDVERELNHMEMQRSARLGNQASSVSYLVNAGDVVLGVESAFASWRFCKRAAT